MVDRREKANHLKKFSFRLSKLKIGKIGRENYLTFYFLAFNAFLIILFLFWF